MIRNTSRTLCLPLAYLSLSVLAGCAQSPITPHVMLDLRWPRQVLVTNLDADPPLNEILVAQAGPDHQSRWTLLDMLSVPRARQVLDHGHWHNDGFMPPNPQASRLFSAMIFAWTPTQDLLTSYGPPNQVTVQRDQDGRLVRTLRDADGSMIYQITMMEQHNTDDMMVESAAAGVHWHVQALPATGAPH